MFASAKLAVSLVGVKPELALAARNQCGRIEHQQARAVRRGTQRASTSTIFERRQGRLVAAGLQQVAGSTGSGRYSIAVAAMGDGLRLRQRNSTAGGKQSAAAGRERAIWRGREHPLGEAAAKHRIFDIDLEHCPNRDDELKTIACIEDPVVIEKFLAHLDAKAAAAQLCGRPP